MKILPGIKANFEIQQSTGLDTLNVIISNTSSGPITSYKWFIGDSIFTVKEPTQFTIFKPGNYDVTLIVSDGFYSDTLTKVDYLNIIQSPISSEYIQKHASFSSDTSNFSPDIIIPNKKGYLILGNKNNTLNMNSRNYSFVKIDSNINTEFITNEFKLTLNFNGIYSIDDTTFFFTNSGAKCLNSNNQLYSNKLNFTTFCQDHLDNQFYIFERVGLPDPPRFYATKCLDFYTGKFDSLNYFKIGWISLTSDIDFYTGEGYFKYNIKVYSHNNSFFFFETFNGKYRSIYDKDLYYDDSGIYCHFSKITKLPNGKDTLIWLVPKRAIDFPLNFHVLNHNLVSFVMDNYSAKSFNFIVNYKIGENFTYSQHSYSNNYCVTFPYNDSLFLAGGSINGKATLFFLSTEDLAIKKTITLNSLYGNITSIERASDGEFLLLAENKINKKFDSFLALKTKNLGKDAYPVGVIPSEQEIKSSDGKYFHGNNLVIYYDDTLSSPFLEIYDFMGRKLVSTNDLMIDSKTKQVTCDLSQFGNEITERAIYFYILRDSGNVIRGKFMR
jgi:PKD repeat protein